MEEIKWEEFKNKIDENTTKKVNNNLDFKWKAIKIKGRYKLLLEIVDKESGTRTFFSLDGIDFEMKEQVKAALEGELLFQDNPGGEFLKK